MCLSLQELLLLSHHLHSQSLLLLGAQVLVIRQLSTDCMSCSRSLSEVSHIIRQLHFNLPVLVLQSEILQGFGELLGT